MPTCTHSHYTPTLSPTTRTWINRYVLIINFDLLPQASVSLTERSLLLVSHTSLFNRVSEPVFELVSFCLPGGGGGVHDRWIFTKVGKWAQPHHVGDDLSRLIEGNEKYTRFELSFY